MTPSLLVAQKASDSTRSKSGLKVKIERVKNRTLRNSDARQTRRILKVMATDAARHLFPIGPALEEDKRRLWGRKKQVPLEIRRESGAVHVVGDVVTSRDTIPNHAAGRGTHNHNKVAYFFKIKRIKEMKQENRTAKAMVLLYSEPPSTEAKL